MPPQWRLSALNDQHAYLTFPADSVGPAVGDLIGLGISHPCTTFDKWHWLPVIDDDYRVVGRVGSVEEDVRKILYFVSVTY